MLRSDSQKYGNQRMTTQRLIFKQRELRRESELKEHIHFLQKLIDSIPCPMFYKDREGVYRGCNKAFESYLGITPKEIIGKSVYDLSPFELAEKYHAMDENLFQEPGEQLYESSVMYADGTKHDVIFNKATYNNTKNQLAGIVGILTDITERKIMEQALQDSSEKVKMILDQTVQAMASISETRDLYTAGHQQRVSELAVAIASKMKLEEEVIKSIKVAGILHDIGKIAIPSEILTKPGKLNVYEFGIIKTHAEAGYEILKPIDFPTPIAEIVRQHHERLDGSGYPRALCGTEILLEAQIIGVADVVEAMSSHRPYRPGLGIVKAIVEINSNKGVHYSSEIVEACLAVFEQGFQFKIG